MFGAVASIDSDRIWNIVHHADLEAIVVARTGELNCSLDDTCLKRGLSPAEYR